MSGHLCIELYPPGTLGRIFIDLSLNYMDKSLYELRDNTICINDPVLFAQEIEGILQQFYVRRVKCFYFTGNDNTSVGKVLGSFYSKDDPTTIIRFVIESLKNGGYNNLAKKLTAPALARIEFFEYSKPGYIARISDKHKDHPYKHMNVMSLALAVLGGYIGYVTQSGKGFMVYLIPLRYIESVLLKEIKKKIADYYNSPPNILAYIVANYMAELGVISGSPLGFLITIDKSGKRPTLVRSELLASEGLENIISNLSKTSREIINAILDLLRIYYDELPRARKSATFQTVAEFVAPLITIVSDIYRASRGSGEALYDCIRTIVLVRDSIINSLEKGGKNTPWRRLYFMLKDRVDHPLGALSILIRDLSNIIKLEEWRGIYQF